MNFTTQARFSWIAACRNTIKEIKNTFNAPKAVAKDIQGMIAQGATLAQVESVAFASWMLRNEVGF